MEEIIIDRLFQNEGPTSVLVIGLAIYIVRVIRRIENDLHAISESTNDIRSQISYLRGSSENTK